MPPYLLAFLVASLGSAFAQTSLYLPGFDPQPIIADILGVDDQGRTTWAIHEGSTTDYQGGIFGTATLVEGPNDAALTYVVPVSFTQGLTTIGIACSLSGDVAVCSGTDSGVVVTETETFTRIQVEAGTTAPLTTTPTATTTTPTTTPTNGSNSSSTGNTHTTTTPSNPTSSPKSNNANALGPYLQPLFMIAAAVAVYTRL